MRTWQAVIVGVIIWFVVLIPLKGFVPGMEGLLGFLPTSCVGGLLVGLLATRARRKWAAAVIAGLVLYLVQGLVGAICLATEGISVKLAPVRGIFALLLTLSGSCLGGAAADYLHEKRRR